jgi:hypothetical protein
MPRSLPSASSFRTQSESLGNTGLGYRWIVPAERGRQVRSSSEWARESGLRNLPHNHLSDAKSEAAIKAMYRNGPRRSG